MLLLDRSHVGGDHRRLSAGPWFIMDGVLSSRAFVLRMDRAALSLMSEAMIRGQPRSILLDVVSGYAPVLQK